MHSNYLKKCTLLIFATLSVFFISSCKKSQGIDRAAWQETTLSNGLTLFTAEDHSAPLVYIEIAVRTGGIHQTPETAGLFHLYEHMIFKGNALYPDAASVQRALSNMGVTNWNGSTSVDCVNYFFTVPSSQLENGLAFWNAAIRAPLMDETELEHEKSVVLSEIKGHAGEPAFLFTSFISKHLFPDAPYRVDSAGSFKVVEEATVAALRDIQETYYVPSNASVYVGGDISVEKTQALVETIFGSWKNSAKSGRVQKNPQQNTAPFEKPFCVVFPYEQTQSRVADITVTFRGPDTDFNIEDTYTADYLQFVMDEPHGIFSSDLLSVKELKIPQNNYVWSSYSTVRQNGLLRFGATVTDPEENLPERALLFAQEIKTNVLPHIVSSRGLFTKKKAHHIVDKLSRDFLISSDTAQGLLNHLRYWWLETDNSYFDTYFDRVAQVSQKDAQAFVAKYVETKEPLIAVIVNPQVYEKTVADYQKAGFTVLTGDEAEALWWREEKWQPSVHADFSSETDFSLIASEIYRPTLETEQAQAYSAQYLSVAPEQYELVNHIPVYVQRNNTKRVATVQIAVRGGAAHITKETAGLERALLDVMTLSSKKYDFAHRQQIFHETKSSMSCNTWMTGSVLSLFSLDTDLYKLLPLLTDGFLHPNYEERVYELLMDGYRQDVQQTLNDPSSLLAYEAQKCMFEGHPYETSVFVTPESLSNISIEHLAEAQKKLYAAEDIFVVAVGNVDTKKLIGHLNKTLGTLKQTGDSKVSREVPPLVVTPTEPLVLTHPAASGAGYILRLFASAPNTGADYVPAVIASSVYSDILFNVVRERNGICYTPYSYTVGSKAPLGGEVLVSVTDYEHFAAALQEARGIMAQGITISGLNEDRSYAFLPLEERLLEYKNKYINSLYGSNTSTSGMAAALSYNLVQFDDILHSRTVIEEIQALTASDITRVFETYWLLRPSRYFAIVEPGAEQSLVF